MKLMMSSGGLDASQDISRFPVVPTVSEALLQGILVACKTELNALTQESLQPPTYFPHVLLSEHKGQG